MTYPAVKDTSTYSSAAAEPWSHTLPADIDQGDLILVWRFSGANVADGIVLGDDDLRGFSTQYDSLVSTSVTQSSLHVKIANGDEGGMTIGPLGNNRGRASRALVLSGASKYSRTAHGDNRQTAATNPNPPSINLTLFDYLTFAYAGCNSLSVAAPSGSFSGYTNQTTLTANGGGTNGGYLVHAWKETTATSEDPSALTRASAAYIATTYSVPGVNPADDAHARIARHDHFKSTSGTGDKDFTISLLAGSKRKLCVFIGSSSAPSSVTLDPGGLNIQLRQAEFDGVVSEASNGRWYETSALPIVLANYTLRVVSTSANAITVNAIQLNRAGNVVGVANDTQTGGAPNSFDVTSRPRGLILAGVYGTVSPFAASASATTRAVALTAGTVGFALYGENFGNSVSDCTSILATRSLATAFATPISYTHRDTTISAALSVLCIGHASSSPPHIGEP